MREDTPKTCPACKGPFVTWPLHIAIPATLMFLIFLLESNSEGLASTLNSIFIGHTEVISEASAKIFVRYYHMIAVFIFMVTWMVPWVSPARRHANSEMDRWWSRNGSKLPLAASENR